LLLGDDSAFLLVCAAREDSVEPAVAYAHDLSERGHRLAMVVANRLAPEVPEDGGLPPLDDMHDFLEDLGIEDRIALHSALADLQQERALRFQRQATALHTLRNELSDLPLLALTEAEHPPHDLNDLSALARAMHNGALL